MAKVLIVGGTHGNEMSGIALVQQWETGIDRNDYKGLDIECILANTEAIEANVRFIDEDLNRQFTLERLEGNAESLESGLARQLNHHYGPKGSSQTDVVIDIHNTTSAMGATLILPSDDEWYIRLGRYVKTQMPHANILLENDQPYMAHPYLCTLGKRGVMIEVGAQPQGLLRADVYQLTQEMLVHTLRFCYLDMLGNVPNLACCDAFQLGENVYFPVDDSGQRTAMIHPLLQDKDFQALYPGDPVFLRFDGTTVHWNESEVSYPHFINEAAYKRQNVAFSKSRKISL